MSADRDDRFVKIGLAELFGCVGGEISKMAGAGCGFASFREAGMNRSALSRERRVGSIVDTDAFTSIDERTLRSKMVRNHQRNRRHRERFFDPVLFADPAWDMLLELYGSYLEQRRIAVSSLCIAAHVPATTALRWIVKLEQDGLAVRIDDPNDGRRSWIELTDDGVGRMSRYFETQPMGR